MTPERPNAIAFAVNFNPRRAPLVLVAASALMAAVGCGSSSPASGTGGSSGGGGDSGELQYSPCAANTRAGNFSVQLTAKTTEAAAGSQFGGGVKDSVPPLEYRQELVTEGPCVLTTAPTVACSPVCGSQKVCIAGQCVKEPTYQDLGEMTLTLPTAKVPMSPVAANDLEYYADLRPYGYPPVAPGGTITLSSAGGTYPSFTLHGRGIAELEVPSATLELNRDQPFTVTWTKPAVGSSTHVIVRLEIAHHGGGQARLECDVPDNGTATVPATLVNKLMDQGIAGFPEVSLTRRTADSVTLAAGCVEFSVSSSVARQITIDGIISCTCDDGSADTCGDKGVKCPTGRACRAVGVPMGGTCE